MFLGSKSESEYRVKRAFLSLSDHLVNNKPICDEDKKIISYFCSLMIAGGEDNEQQVKNDNLNLIDKINIQFVSDDKRGKEKSAQDYIDDKLQIYLLKKSKIKSSRIIDIVNAAREERALRRVCEKLDERFNKEQHWYRLEKLPALQSAYASLIKARKIDEDEHKKIVCYLVALKTESAGEVECINYQEELKVMRYNIENMDEVLSGQGKSMSV